jgi:hypothetical protein
MELDGSKKMFVSGYAAVTLVKMVDAKAPASRDTPEW